MSLEELKQKKNKAFNTFNQYTKAQEIAFNEYRDVCREYRKAEQVDSNNKAYEEWILNKTMVYCICGLRGDVNITDFYAPEFTILKENLKNILKENLDQDVAVVRVESIINNDYETFNVWFTITEEPTSEMAINMLQTNYLNLLGDRTIKVYVVDNFEQPI